MKDVELKEKTQKARRSKRQVDCVVIPPPYYQDDCVTIYNADCMDIVESLAPDVIITDPPYPNFHIDGYNYYDGILDFLTQFGFLQLIFWTDKEDFPLNYTAKHKWNKLCGTYATTENIYERNGKNIPYSFNYQKIKNKIDAQMNRDILTGHKSQKPQRLMKELVKKFSEPGDTILDPFMGSGSTLFAAKEMGRKSIGIELNKKWCQVAAERLAQGVLPL